MNIERNYPQARALPEGEAHVWRVALHDAPGDRSAWLECLSREEHERVQRQRSEEAKIRFALTRLALRHILARYTGVAPGAVELVIDAQGKPHLTGEHGLHFSISHAERLALIAVATGAVGVDVERLRTPARLLLIAQRVLHADTVSMLAALSGAVRERAFLDAWTQRESHVKAIGGGLFATPDVLPVNIAQPADGAPYACVERAGAALWTVARFQPGTNARASLVARGHIERVRFFDWNTDDPNLREVT